MSSIVSSSIHYPKLTYSTDEKEMRDVWIDGKSIFIKCFTGILSSYRGTIPTYTGIDTVISFIFNVYDDTNDRLYNIAGNFSNPQAIIQPSANQIAYSIFSAFQLRRKPYYAIITYTKI